MPGTSENEVSREKRAGVDTLPGVELSRCVHAMPMPRARNHRAEHLPESPTMRLLGYFWAAPVTVLGLLLAFIAAVTGGKARWRGGVVEAWGGLTGQLLRGGRLLGGGGAMTLGHAILARDALCLDRSRQHELEHVRQFERWGPFLLPAYWSISVWLWCRGLDPYLDHPLEPPPD